MAIKFPLKMKGVDVRNLEDLRKNFELNAAIQYFKEGKLLKWLEARYYEDEADKISVLNENASDFQEKLCAALGVEFNEEFGSVRLEEKKAILSGLTDNESIIANAAATALTQEDLAELLDAGTSTIYLCGNIFSVPSRVRNKKYIGVLDPPMIKIRANSQAELDDKNISFENVVLPFDNPSVAEEKVYTPISSNSVTVPLEQLKDLYKANFSNKKIKEVDVWELVEEYGRSVTKKLSAAQKNVILRMLCKNHYTEEEIVHVCINDDFSNGWAFTKDSFGFFVQCVGTVIIPYKDFISIIVGSTIPSEQTIEISYNDKSNYTAIAVPRDLYKGAFRLEIMRNVEKYLNVAKSLFS